MSVSFLWSFPEDKRTAGSVHHWWQHLHSACLSSAFRARRGHVCCSYDYVQHPSVSQVHDYHAKSSWSAVVRFLVLLLHLDVSIQYPCCCFGNVPSIHSHGSESIHGMHPQANITLLCNSSKQQCWRRRVLQKSEIRSRHILPTHATMAQCLPSRTVSDYTIWRLDF